MKELFQALYTKLINSNDLQSYVSDRVFLEQAPEGTDYPYVVFGLISDNADFNFTNCKDNVRIQFDLISNSSSPVEVSNIYYYLITLLDECELIMDTYSFLGIWREFSTLRKIDDIWQYTVQYRILVNKTR